MDNLLEVRDLNVLFPVKKKFLQRRQYVHAVRHVNLDIKQGSIVGLVGESGSGKTTTGKAILHLVEPTSGTIRFRGEGTNRLQKESQMIFQDPFSSLNPQKTIHQSLETPMIIHGIGEDRDSRSALIGKTLQSVGLTTDVLDRFPHEFSGGQLQRICIARVLLLRPSFLVCDEAIAALDVSIQSQIINLFKQLKDEYDLTYLFISHNISVLKYLCDEIGVMYLGEIVEFAPTQELFSNPRHPYTRALLRAVPVPNPRLERAGAGQDLLEGEMPNPIHPPPGCSFSTRCPHAAEQCRRAAPEYKVCGEGHRAACHLISHRNEG